MVVCGAATTRGKEILDYLNETVIESFFFSLNSRSRNRSRRRLLCNRGFGIGLVVIGRNILAVLAAALWKSHGGGR